MTTIASSKVTTKGRITLPREIREGLDVQEGENLALQEVAKGIVLLVKAPLSRTQVAERLLDSLVVGIGQEAKKMGIREEDDLDAIVKALRRRSFKERYGGQIEEYPERYRCLIYGVNQDNIPVHVSCEYHDYLLDASEDILVVTVYVPNREKWIADSVRKRKRRR